MTRAYARSKLALLMTQMTLAERLDPAQVAVNVVHPGMVATGLVREPGMVGLAWRLMAPFILSEREGADTPLHAALSPECAGLSGAYLKRRRPVPPNRRAVDPSLRARGMDGEPGAGGAVSAAAGLTPTLPAMRCRNASSLTCALQPRARRLNGPRTPSTREGGWNRLGSSAASASGSRDSWASKRSRPISQAASAGDSRAT